MYKILLVDDAAVDRKLFGNLLEKESDYHVSYAENGREALMLMRDERFDLVVTDLQMPQMDGLELVSKIQSQHLGIPAILLTGQGSEALATRALRLGAAGYVPKSHGADLLVSTVRHVLDISRAKLGWGDLVAAVDSLEMKLTLPNQSTAIQAASQATQELLLRLGMRDAVVRLQVAVALGHALQNAMIHGNLELTSLLHPEDCDEKQRDMLVKQRAQESPYCDRRITLVAQADANQATFIVRDEGPGFNVTELSHVGVSMSHARSGRGLFLMWAFVDKVKFNQSGNQISLTKLLPRRNEPLKVAAVEEAEPSDAPPQPLGELVPSAGGNAILLTKCRVIIGKEPSCDVVLDSPDISRHHCLLYIHEGWWYVKDLNSRNGVKVNNHAVEQRRVNPGYTLRFGHFEFRLDYSPHELGAVGVTPPVDPF
ncbi:MAG: response regulator [Planctomycetales bacterium]|nr:response regulator [Planctomycetales bacterium]